MLETMSAKTGLLILLIAQASQFAAAVFFHEPSSVLIKPYAGQNDSDFGFAMGYQAIQNRLVASAPTEDNMGKVYSCDMTNADSVTQIDCDEVIIDVESVEYSRKLNPNQYFYTGASIAATSSYFFTCSPLLTMDIEKQYTGVIMSNAFGTCFVTNDTGSEQYKGTVERYLKHRSKITNYNSFLGGTGWSTLMDEENDLLLIAKTSLTGDFVFTPMSSPLKETKSLVLMTDYASKQSKQYLQASNNIGYGLTAGKFFSNRKTVYAFSMERNDMIGAISFLEYNSKQNKLSIMFKNSIPYKLETHAINTMFGNAMGAADLDMDGLDELLVGAPAQSDEECVECGALHIYRGGDVNTIRERNRHRTILGSSYCGRFGSAIAAKDIDGDSIPEIVVTAPYENSGLGAVYILSGYELHHTLFGFQSIKTILSIQDLKLTQRIQKEHFTTLGFSLQFINDTDKNGCNELAAGAPGSGSVLLYRCIQKINVTLSTELIGEQIVREQDQNFTVKVCAQVELPNLPINIVGNISIVSSIIGDATFIPDPQFAIDIACFNCSKDRKFYKNVTIVLNDNEPGDYTFTSKAELYTDYIFKSTEFNHTWVVASPYSKLVSSLEVPRHCKGGDCIPKLSMEILWSGSKKYVLGSSLNETVTLRVRNDGNASYDSCVWVRLSGAPLTRVDCAADRGGYRCYLPKPLRRNTEHSINLILNMTKPSNLAEELLVNVSLYENCNQKAVISGHIKIPYIMTTDNIYAAGESHSRNITDKQILDSEFIFNEQEYLITNNGSIAWKNVQVLISMEEKPYISSSKVSATDSSKCGESRNAGIITHECILDLMPNSNQTIIATTEIFASHIQNILADNEMLNITSQLFLHLTPTEEIKYTNVTTFIRFEKEMSFANNKLLIGLLALLLAIIILAILIIVLYKYGFFRRKQKQRLHVLRESVRKHSERANSTRHPTHTSDALNGQPENAEGLQMDVDDDCPFDDPPQPVTTADTAILMHEQAPSHC